MPVTDDRNGIIGRLRVLYIAEFNLWVQLQSILDFLLYTWDAVLFFSVPIGIACGLVASRYVTRQSPIMGAVSMQPGKHRGLALPPCGTGRKTCQMGN
jgi:two-component system, NarL family, sensor histidine kinase LiaS